MVMADLTWGHIDIFLGDTRGLYFSREFKRSLLAGYAKN